jgi:uncharacterized protein involved in exopolysaccharide biosynthesis
MAITKLESSRDFLRIWFYWQRQAVFVLFLIVGLTMFYAYTVTPLYESRAGVLVQPKTNEGEVISSGLDTTKRIVPVTTQDIYTEMELISADQVLRSTVQSFGERGMGLDVKNKTFISRLFSSLSGAFRSILVAVKLKNHSASKLDRQVARLKGALRIEPVVDSDVITVSMRAERPAEATNVISRLLKFYFQHRNTVYTKKAGLSFYDEQSTKYRQKLNEAEKRLNAFQKDWSIVNMRGQNEANIGLLAKLTNELKMQQIAYDGSLSRISMLKKKLLGDPGGLYLTKDMRAIPVIVELEKGIVPLLVKRSEISRNFTKTSREYQSINGQVSMLRQEIHQEIEKAIKTDEIETYSLKIQLDSLRKEIAVLRDSSNKFSQKRRKLAELQRQVDLYKKGYLLYSGKTEDAMMFSEKTKRNIANVSIASAPSASESPVFPNRMAMLFVSLFIGGFMAIATPFLLESIDNKLKTADDVEALLELPVICSFSDFAK